MGQRVAVQAFMPMYRDRAANALLSTLLAALLWCFACGVLTLWEASASWSDIWNLHGFDNVNGTITSDGKKKERAVWPSVVFYIGFVTLVIYGLNVADGFA